MFTTVKITKDIILEPKHLTFEIDRFIESELRQKYEKKCCDDYGLLISIDSIESIDNTVNKDSIYITFMVTFYAKVIKPVKDMKVSFIPTLILSKGIFGKIYDNINFFIPDTNLTEMGYVFDSTTSSFKNEKKNKNKLIDKSTNVSVVIDQLKYDLIKYNCITYLE